MLHGGFEDGPDPYSTPRPRQESWREADGAPRDSTESEWKTMPVGQNPSGSRRRVTDREIGLILRRAVELDKGSPSKAVSSARGLTLAELQEIAKEAGIDPGMVGRAVAEMENKGSLEPRSIGGPSPVKREVRTVPGKLPPEKVGGANEGGGPGSGGPGDRGGGPRWSAVDQQHPVPEYPGIRGTVQG
jgi:hypothetical protein